MSKTVKVIYNAETPQTQITVDGNPFDTSRIDGKEIADWAYPFILRKIKWNGFYEEMTEALGEKEFNLIFEGSESDLNELKEAWEDAPVTIISEEAGNVVTITYDEKSLSTEITVNGQPFDTSRINGKEIADWVYPFMIRKVKWDGIFEELSKAVGSEEYTINFSTSDHAINDVIKIIMSECPETVNMIFDSNVNKKNTATVASPETSNESLEELNEKAKAFAQNGDFENAFACFKKAAEGGLAKAQYNVGRSYYYGNGVQQNYQKAFEWFMKAAGQGIPQAQSWVGSLYEDGEGVQQDYNKSFEWYMKAAEQGHDLSQYHVGRCYHHGKGVSDDGKKALNWYKKAAEQGNVAAQSTLGCLYFFGDSYNRVDKNMSKAIEWLTQAAAQNDVRSMILLEELHRRDVAYYGFNPDIGIAKELIERAVAISPFEIYETAKLYMDKGNYKRGAYCYNIAAENGNVTAQYLLASCYKRGEGVDQDDKKAFEWFMKAAKQDNFEAKIAVAEAYYYGKGVEINYDKAGELFKEASEGNYKLQYFAATRYPELNLSLRLELLEKSAQAGYADAKEELEKLNSLVETTDSSDYSQDSSSSAEENNSYDDVDEEVFAICNFFDSGDYRIAPKNEVMEKLEKAENYARQGHPLAQYTMSAIYFDGELVEEDLKKGIVYLRKAAESGFQVAEYLWGILLCSGEFVEKNQSLGWEFIERAADHGFTLAQIDMADKCFHENDYKNAAYYLEQAAEQGYEGAMWRLGIMHYSGLYYDEDIDTAMEYLNKSAELGFPEAMCDVADEYFYGDYYEGDVPYAISLYERALETDEECSHALFKLGLCYYLGVGKQKDEEYGLELIKKASDLGESEADDFLADLDKIQEQAMRSARFLNNVERAFDIAQSIPILSEYIAPVKLGWDIGKRIDELFSGQND